MPDDQKQLPAPESEEHDEDAELGGHMTFIEHLEELRTRLVRIITVLGVGTLVCFAFSGTLLHLFITQLRTDFSFEEVAILQEWVSKGARELWNAEEIPLNDLVGSPEADGAVLSATQTAQVLPESAPPPLTDAELETDRVVKILKGIGELLKHDKPVADALKIDRAVEEYLQGVEAEDEDKGIAIVALNPLEIFFAKIKVSFVVALFLFFPYLFYEIWMFVSPGLYMKERKFLLPTVASTWLCFLVGGGFAFFMVIPVMAAFMAGLSAGAGVQNTWSLMATMNYAIHLVLAFGVIFEEPVVIAMLTKLGLVGVDGLKKARPYVIVGLFVVGAMVTPPDPISQVMCATPLILLYEVSILMVPLFQPKESEEPAEE